MTSADLIDLYFFEDFDLNAVAEGVYAGMLESLGDPYSEYYTAEEYEALNEVSTGVYCGTGAVLTQDPETMAVTVVQVYPDTPAAEAGLKDGDVIVKVGDIEANTMELTELTSYIKGEEGTTVHLTIARQGRDDYLEFDVTRRPVTIPSLAYVMLEGKVGLIQVAEFSTATPEQFDKAIDDLESQGVRALIIDLRDNPGGALEAVCTMLDKILPKGLIVYTEDRNGERVDENSDAACMDLPMAVLVNENSASASEIFAGAIQDYGYGTIIGTTTFGKGIVQTLFPLDDGSAVKVTTAKYFTPKGKNIHGVGIKPDIEVEYEYTGKEDEEYDPMLDKQVVKALETLKGE